MIFWKLELQSIIEEYKADTTIEALLSPGRSNKEALYVKKIFCLRMRARGWSYPSIGRVLNRDHATIHSYLKPKGETAKRILNKWKEYNVSS